MGTSITQGNATSMSDAKPHLRTLEEIERDCIPGLVEVLRAFLETTDLPFREASNIRRLAADDDTETARLLEVSVLLQIAVGKRVSKPSATPCGI